MVPIGRRHHLPVERAGLDEVVVVLVRLVGHAHDLGALHKPARVAVALQLLVRRADSSSRVISPAVTTLRISPRMHPAGSVAVSVNLDTTPVQLHTTTLQTEAHTGARNSSYLD